MNGPCDIVQFNYYGVIVLSVITSVVCTKKFSVSFNKAQIGALGMALSGTLL